MKKSKNKRAREPKRKDARAHLGPKGRVHLALYQDPGTSREQVLLKQPVFSESWQNEVALSGAGTVRAMLGAKPSLERLIELTRKLMDATSRLADGFLARAPAGSVACSAGCDHCCHQSVGVTPPEALAIWDHVNRSRSEAELAELAAHVAERFEKTRGLSSRERFSPDHPCVFLESGRCSIYEVRPLSCRGMNSLDANECRARLRDAEARAAFLASGAGSRSFMEPIRAFHAVSAGLQLGLHELYELDVRPLDLVAAMHLLFTSPPSIGQAWLTRADAFAQVQGGDSTSDHFIRELSGTLSR